MDLNHLYAFNISGYFQEISLSDFLKETQTDFETLGITSSLTMRRSATKLGFVLNLSASDLLQRGGFLAKEELIKLTLEKLSLEVEQLRSQNPERVELYTSILANITTVLSFFG